jgi:hypothetical protein
MAALLRRVPPEKLKNNKQVGKADGKPSNLMFDHSVESHKNMPPQLSSAQKGSESEASLIGDVNDTNIDVLPE